jgi:hypothetical protein
MSGRNAVHTGLFWCAGQEVALGVRIQFWKNQDLLIFQAAGEASLRRFVQIVLFLI